MPDPRPHPNPLRHTGRRPVLALLVPIAAVLAPIALGQFVVTFVAPFHGAPCTEYAAWESFTQPENAPNAPDDPTTTSPDSAVWQLAAGGSVNASGNLDNLLVPPVYRITDGVPADLQEVVLQVSIHLNQMNWSSFFLNYVDALGVPQSVAPITSVYLVHQMGHDERVITWDLSANPDTITSYTIDFAANNSFTTLDAVKLDTRHACGGVPFCAGDGIDPLVSTACPCGNTGAIGHGCANSVVAAGALLASGGTPAADDVQLLGSSMPATVSCIYLQGDQLTDIVFGDGVRCAGGTLIRLRAVVNVGGASSFPDTTTTITLSTRGGVVPGSGAVRYYQTYYRNAAGLFCPPETFNITNGIHVTW